jgi:hypothetical protein
MKKLALLALATGALCYLSKHGKARKLELEAEEKIDSAIEDSFPASDPPAVTPH